MTALWFLSGVVLGLTAKGWLTIAAAVLAGVEWVLGRLVAAVTWLTTDPEPPRPVVAGELRNVRLVPPPRRAGVSVLFMGLPLDRSDERKVRRLADQVEVVLGELVDESTGRPVVLKDGWWRA